MSARKMHVAGALFCVAAMGVALYLQYGLGQEPCPLCILQRFAMIALGTFFLLAAIHNPNRFGQHFYGLLQFAAAAAGIAVAGRHVWLQSLPADQVPACGPGYDYLMENFPLLDAFSVIFRGSGECATIGWSFHGITLPQLTLAAFVVLFLWVLLLQWRVVKRHQ
ncbi:MAG: disulfide bond formation protein B [Burkholderiaceae bacterium]|nr:MAG: disulfide bond formation protein B [Burkholderiaceae bacterium]